MARTRIARDALTQKQIQALRPTVKRQYLWDGQVPGLGVLVHPSGTKTFIVQRGTGGATVRRALGSFPEMGLAEARRLAEEPLATIRAGRNPNEERRAARTAAEKERRERASCTDLWTRYRTEIIALKNRDSTASEKERMWKARIEPVIGKRSVREIDATHVREIVQAPLKLDLRGQVIGGKGEAGNLFRLLKHMLRTAELWKLRPKGSDPTTEVEHPRVPRRNRLLKDSEITRLLNAVAIAEGEGLKPQVAGAIRMILLTGWRLGEVLTLERTFVDRVRREARLPDTKSGDSIRPLAAETIALLDAQPRVVGSPYYFPGLKDPRRPLSESTLAQALKRVCAQAGVAHASAHVVRHRVVTEVASKAPNMRVGMMLSGHKSVTAFMTYVHADQDPATEVADSIASRMAELAKAPIDDTVVQLSPKRRRARR